MNTKVYCPICDMKVDYVISLDEVTQKVKEKTYTLRVKVPHCIHCNEILFVKYVESESQQLFFDLYRKDHQLPTVLEMINIRKKLGLNQRDFSRLLGLGEISISRYELGSLPYFGSVALIPFILEAKILERQLKLNQSKLSEEGIIHIKKYLKKYDEVAFTGHTRFSEEKFQQLVSYFVHQAKEHKIIMYPTKLNELMFLTDFNYYNKFGCSITGSKYLNMSFGAVPHDYELKYEKNEYIEVVRNEEKTIINPKHVPNESLLTQEELNVAGAVLSHFIHHEDELIGVVPNEEQAWQNTKLGDNISYFDAHDLKIMV